MTGQTSTLALALKIHGRLAELVAPATPESIRASSLRGNKVLCLIAVVGTLCFLLLFIDVFVPIESEWNDYLDSGLYDFIQVFAAAGLGSTFYSLITANQYIRKQTFDPSYNQFYIVRFVLGVFAGVILGRYSVDLLDVNSFTAEVTRPALALVGGFAAEAVAQILKRFSETLVTMVRGSDKEAARAEAQKEASQKATRAASDLQAALTLDQESAKKTIESVIKSLLK